MKSAIVTGANSEIGIVICKQLLEENYNVVACVHKNDDRIKKMVHEKLIIKKVNLRNENEIIALGLKADVIVNAAAYYFDDYYQNVTKADFMETLEVNVVAPFLMVKHLLADFGTVVNISSTDGIDTYNDINITYSVSKAALNHLTQNMAYAKKDAKFYALALGWVNTEMIRSINQDYLNDEMKRTNQKRLVELTEIKNEIKNILNDKYKTGSIIRIDGESNEF